MLLGDQGTPEKEASFSSILPHQKGHSELSRDSDCHSRNLREQRYGLGAEMQKENVQPAQLFIKTLVLTYATHLP